MRPSVDPYLVEAALAFARTCATTFGMRATRVSARFADVIHSTNSRRCVNENASSAGSELLDDNVGILATPLEYHTPKLPGLGEVDWGRFISVLQDVGYDGPVCIEVEDRAYEKTLELRKASLRQSGTFLRNFIP